MSLRNLEMWFCGVWFCSSAFVLQNVCAHVAAYLHAHIYTVAFVHDCERRISCMVRYVFLLL